MNIENTREYKEFMDKYYKHKTLVNDNAERCANIMMHRAEKHDDSKKEDPELSMFIKSSKVLYNVKYGTDDYNKTIDNMKKEALGHHYFENPHHPEHYEKGVAGMNLFDILEMMCDWAAASKQYGTELADSIETSIKRFGLEGTIMEDIIRNSIPYFYKYGIRLIYPDGVTKIYCSNSREGIIRKIRSMPTYVGIPTISGLDRLTTNDLGYSNNFYHDTFIITNTQMEQAGIDKVEVYITYHPTFNND